MENSAGLLKKDEAKSSKKQNLKFEDFFVKFVRPLFCEFFASFLHTFWGCMVYQKPLLPNCKDFPNNSTNTLPECRNNDVIEAFIPALQAGIAVWMITVLFHRITYIQFNPIMSMSFVLVGLLPWKLFIPNVVVQLTGASFGALLAKVIKHGDIEIFAIADNANISAILSTEIFNTGIMVTFVLAITKNSLYDQPTGPMAMGFSVFQAILTSSSIGVTCLNPIRAFGPALVTGYWKNHWVWWVGPGIGSLVFTFIYMCFLAENTDSWLIGFYQNRKKKKIKFRKKMKNNISNGI